MDVSRVTTKGQVTIPKRIRLSAGIAVGDLVRFTETEGVVSLTKVISERGAGGEGLAINLEEWDSEEDASAWRDF